MAAQSYRVMLSSTFLDLKEHRELAVKALRRHGLEVIAMEDRLLSITHDVIDESLAKVEKADAYLCLVGKRYGAVHECPERNPGQLSTTALEFQRAQELELPIASILFTTAYALPEDKMDLDPEPRAKLNELRVQLLKHRVAGQVNNEAEFLDAAYTAAHEFGEALSARDAQKRSIHELRVGRTSRRALDSNVPEPPAFYFVTPPATGMTFVGRERELDELTEWACTDDPLIVVEAIGGMGKSMVTHHWAVECAPNKLPDLAGRFWYSFYEEGANMRDFCERALAYIERVAPSEIRRLSRRDLRVRLVQRLTSDPWLLVLDGLERVLIAYQRFDAAQMSDEEADKAHDDRMDPNLCIHPEDDELLRDLAAVHSSKVLVSTRIMPTALRLSSGAVLRAGVSHLQLTGLAGDDAERLMRRVGVSGDGTAMRRFLERNFGGHPLMVGVVAGLVMDHFPAPSDFGHWLVDPDGANALDLSSIDGLVRKRNHVLKTAFIGLEPDAKKLLGRLAFFSSAVDYNTLVALNPVIPPRPEPVDEPEMDPWTDQEDFHALQDEYDQYCAALAAWKTSTKNREAERWLRRTLQSLHRRGLLIREASVASYDLHPLVRGFTRNILSSSDRASTGKELADYARQKAPPSISEESDAEEIAAYFEVVRLLLLGEQYFQAAMMLENSVYGALMRTDQNFLNFELLSNLFVHDISQARPEVPEHSIRPLASNFGLSAAAIGRHVEQNAAQLLVLKRRVEERHSPSEWRSSITNFAISEESLGNIAGARRLFELAGKIPILESDEREKAGFHRTVWLFKKKRGELDWRKYAPFASLNNPDAYKGDRMAIPYLHSEMIELHALLGCLTEDTIQKALAREDVQSAPVARRSILVQQAHFLRDQGEYARARDVLSSVIQLKRAADLTTDSLEAEYSSILVGLGENSFAREQAERLSELRKPPHLQLGQLWLALGEVEKAREQSLLAYPLAWRDGPPNAQHWALQDCIALLAAVNEAVPELPITRPEDLSPYEFEEVLLSLIEEEIDESRNSQ